MTPQCTFVNKFGVTGQAGMGVIHTLIGKVDIQRRFSNILAELAVLWVVQAGLFVCDTFTAIFKLFQAFFETALCFLSCSWR